MHDSQLERRLQTRKAYGAGMVSGLEVRSFYLWLEIKKRWSNVRTKMPSLEIAGVA